MIKATLLNSMGSDLDPAYAAWVSTGRDIDRTEQDAIELIARLAKEGHHSCFEHLVASFMIECPIFIARQIMRHRTFSYNELSGRYKSFSSATCYVPELEDEAVKNFIQEHFDLSIKKYKSMREAGVSKEVARYVLPLNTMTRFQMTGNLRNWIHFLKLRMDSHAQYEVRMVAKQIHAQLLELWPISVDKLL